MTVTTLIFTPDRNTPPKKDYTGAFKPMAEEYSKWLKLTKGEDSTTIAINISKPLADRGKDVAEAVRNCATMHQLKRLVFFCHGWSTGIQLGLSDKTKKDVKQLHALIDSLEFFSPIGFEEFEVILFCCSTGNDDGVEYHDQEHNAPGTTMAAHHRTTPGLGETSFADTVRDELAMAGFRDCRVFAHTTAGHTTRNPDILFFDGMGSDLGGNGGISLARRGTAQYKALVKKLQKDPTFAFELASASVAEAHELIARP